MPNIKVCLNVRTARSLDAYTEDKNVDINTVVNSALGMFFERNDYLNPPPPAERRRMKITKMAKAASVELFHKRFQCLENHYYLYYRPSADGTTGELKVIGEGEEIPKGYNLATPQRLMPSWTINKTEDFMNDVAGRLPIL